MSWTPVLAQAATSGPSVGYLLGLLAASVAVLLFLILKLRLQAFLALLVASLIVAVGAGMPLTEIGDRIVTGMGKSLGFIAAIIGIGAIFGQILESSGGAHSLAHSLVRIFGEKRAPWAMVVTGFIISIPVFFDVGLVIIAPLIYALVRDTKRPLLYYGLPLIAGMGVTHAFVPPTPGPVWVSYELGVSLGWVIVFGVIVGFPTAVISGPMLGRFIAQNIHVSLPEHEQVERGPSDPSKLPAFGSVLLIIGLPIALIIAGTVIEQVVSAGIPGGLTRDERGAAVAEALRSAPLGFRILTFLGHPLIALLLSTLAALYFFGVRRGASRDELLALSTRALGPAGLIILITGAGGVFKQILGDSGVADALKSVFDGSGIPAIVLAYVFATLVRIAQGSATVAMVTAAGLMASIVEGYSQPALALIVIAIAAGATGFSHVNDSGFWMVSRYFGMTEKQTLQSWTVVSTVISVVGFLIALVISFFV